MSGPEIVTDRPDMLLLSLALAAMVASGISSSLLERVARSRTAISSALARILGILILAVALWSGWMIAVLAVPDARALDWPPIRVLGGLVGIVVAGLVGVAISIVERSGRSRSLLSEAVAYGLLTTLIFHGAVAPVLIDAGLLERPGSLVGGFLVATAMTWAGLSLFERRHDVAGWGGGGVLLGMAAFVAYVPTMLWSWAPTEAALPGAIAARHSAAYALALLVGVTHALGWSLVLRAWLARTDEPAGLRRLEALAESLLETRPDWIGILDPRGQVRVEVGRDGLAPRLRVAVGAATREALAVSGQAAVREIEWVAAEGGAEISEIRALDRTADEEIGGVLVVVRTVTEQRSRERELSRQRAIYLDLFERAPLPMLISDAASNRFLDVNPAMTDLYGYSREAMIGMTAADLLVEADLALFDRYRASLASEPGARVEVFAEHRKADGRVFPIRAVGSLFEEGGRVHRLTMIEDISSVVREQGLLGSEIRLLRALARNQDLQTMLEEILELASEARVGAAIAVLVWLDGGSRRIAVAGDDESDRRWLRARVEDLDRGDLDARLAGVSDEPIMLGVGDDASLCVHGVRDRAEGLAAAVVVGPIARRDDVPQDLVDPLELIARVTAIAAERAARELILTHAQRLETLGQVTGGIAHDFNNLLTVILGSADLLASSGSLDGGDRAVAEAIVDSAQRASVITRRLLSMSRRQPQNSESLDLGVLLTELDDWLAGVLGEGIERRITVADEPAWVRCDRALLESAVLNIALNARDAMESSGTLTLSLGRRHVVLPQRVASGRLLPGDYWALTITDTGAGMAPDVLARVLDPFFTTKAGTGTGLGLAMVSGFVTDNHGALDLSSRVGAGTDVVLLLPQAASGSGLAATEAGRPSAALGARRILVVEDEELVGEFVRRALERAGHRVHLEPSADSARAHLEEGAVYDLVLTDIGLPGEMDGVDLAHWIAQARPGLPVLLSSGYAQDRLRAGDEWPMLPKPYDSAMLMRTVNGLLVGEDVRSAR